MHSLSLHCQSSEQAHSALAVRVQFRMRRPELQCRQLSQWRRWWWSGAKEVPETHGLQWVAFPCWSQSFTRNVPVSRGPGSRPAGGRFSAPFKVVPVGGWIPLLAQAQPCSLLSLHPKQPPLPHISYLAHTSDSTVVPQPSSASLDSSWRLG